MCNGTRDFLESIGEQVSGSVVQQFRFIVMSSDSCRALVLCRAGMACILSWTATLRY